MVGTAGAGLFSINASYVFYGFAVAFLLAGYLDYRSKKINNNAVPSWLKYIIGFVIMTSIGLSTVPIKKWFMSYGL